MKRQTRLSLLSLIFPGLLLLPGLGLAQETKESRVPDAKAAPTIDAKRADSDSKGPRLDGEGFLVNREKVKEMAEQKWNEAFGLLKKLIQSTSDQDPAKPDLYYRLSEMYWEKASNTDLRAGDEDERCIERANKDKSAEERCAAQKAAMLQKSQGYRDSAIKIYEHIVKNFPRYPRLDGVLFALAFNFQRKNEMEKAKKIYFALIQRYPESIHVPDTLLNIGEILFEDGQVKPAKKAYEKVVTSYKDSSVYGYALYKLGWCYYNMNEHSMALKQFVSVINYSKAMNKKSGVKKSRLTLYREAKRDLVKAYVHIEEASPVKSINFFRKVVPDDYLELSEKLADLYSITGQFERSNQLYYELIKINKDSYKVVGYQIQIVFNMRNIGKQTLSVQEVKRLVTLWKSTKNAKDAEPERVKKDGEKIKELVQSLAVQYHRQFVKTKSKEDAKMAYILYQEYVETFPNDEEAYQNSFYYAELLYALEKWEEAAKYYEKSLELNPTGKFTKDAAHGTVLAYRKLLNVVDKRQEQGEKAKDKSKKDDDEEDDKVREVPKPKELTDQQKRFIAACDLYSKYVKNSEYLVDISYDGALQYYEANQFDEAIKRFKNISEKFTDHRLSIYAANLLLDTYNLLGDFDSLNKQVDIFLGLYKPERDEEFYNMLLKLKQQSTFKECQAFEGKKQYLEAARCFYRYSKKFEKSEYVDKALYNSALNYKREKRIEQSIQMLLTLVNEHSNSKLVPRALFKIASNLQDLAIYSKASDAYEFYAARFPKEKNAKVALRNAAIFREGLGELDKSLENYQGYLKLVQDDVTESAKVFFSIGMIYKKQNNWKKVIDHYDDYRRKYGKTGPVDLLIESHTITGNAYMERGGRGSEKSAHNSYDTAYKIFLGLSKDDQAKLTTGLNAVAEARFKMGEFIFREFKNTPLKGKAYRNLKKFIKEMTDKIKNKTKYIADARTIYMEVIQFRSPNWAIAALARIGQMFQQAAEDIYNYPAPASFDEEQQEVFKGQMGDMALVQEQKAVDAYITCIKKAQELRWVNSWSELAEQQLARLKPQEYRSNAEIRAKANKFGDSSIDRDYITTLPQE